MPQDKKPIKDWQKIAEEQSLDLDDEANDELKDLDEPVPTASASGVLDHPNYKALEDKLTQAELKAHEQWNRATRAAAELENVRRRAEQEIKKAREYSLEKFANALLPVADSLEQALQCAGDVTTDNMQNMKHGIELTLKLLVDVLAKFEIKQLDPLGDQFNPQLHEAMTTQLDPSVPAGTILTVFQKGYLLNERLIRPARVIVAKN